MRLIARYHHRRDDAACAADPIAVATETATNTILPVTEKPTYPTITKAVKK